MSWTRPVHWVTVEIHVCITTLPMQACVIVSSQALVRSEHRLYYFIQLVSKPFDLHLGPGDLEIQRLLYSKQCLQSYKKYQQLCQKLH